MLQQKKKNTKRKPNDGRDDYLDGRHDFHEHDNTITKMANICRKAKNVSDEKLLRGHTNNLNKFHLKVGTGKSLKWI